MMQKKIKIGVIGAGHLGKYHINHLTKHASIEFVGFFDANQDSAAKIAKEFAVKNFEDMDDLISIKVDFLTIGQYMRPTKNHYPVIKYHEPSYFDDLKKEALNKGFKIVSSSPFTRSSFHADKDFNLLRNIS